MRGLAPLLTGFCAMLVLGETLSPLSWAGLLLATGAVAAFALPPGGTSLRTHPHAGALLWAFGTAIGIALYNVTDARGVRLASTPFTFILWLFLLDGIGVICSLLRCAEMRSGRPCPRAGATVLPAARSPSCPSGRRCTHSR
jgi:drug/metabolite transporter (DMT)-like permease